jgi:hypothetical protein
MRRPTITEELQSTNEKCKLPGKKLQSSNEELNTINEMQSRNVELAN